MTASSRSKGLLVAASTRTLSVSFVRKPSQFTMNSFFIFRMASCSPGFSLLPNMLSTYTRSHTSFSLIYFSVDELKQTKNIYAKGLLRQQISR